MSKTTKARSSSTFFALLFSIALAPAFAGDMATPDEAKAMTEKAMEAVSSMGKDKAFQAFADANGAYQDKDLYVFCMDLNGLMLSHAVKPDLVGKNLLGFDKYGELLFQNMIKVAKDKKEGWVDYKWPYPGTEEIKQKASYVKTDSSGEFFCGVGAYK